MLLREFSHVVLSDIFVFSVKASYELSSSYMPVLSVAVTLDLDCSLMPKPVIPADYEEVHCSVHIDIIIFFTSWWFD